jgi:hypothetical protein
MIDPAILRPAVRRFLLILAVTAALVLSFNEFAYRLVEPDARPPAEITLLIPAGTAARLAEGLNPPGIPAEIRFVDGDILTVENEDSVAHELGPLFIPAHASASLALSASASLEYACSFRPSGSLGLTVQQSVSLKSRLVSLAFVAPAVASIIFVYSLAARPIKPKAPPA